MNKAWTIYYVCLSQTTRNAFFSMTAFLPDESMSRRNLLGGHLWDLVAQRGCHEIKAIFSLWYIPEDHRRSAVYRCYHTLSLIYYHNKRKVIHIRWRQQEKSNRIKSELCSILESEERNRIGINIDLCFYEDHSSVIKVV